MSKFETIAIRTQTKQTEQKEHSVPLFLTSSFTFDDAEEGAALFGNEKEGNIYSRFSNPNVDEFAEKMNRKPSEPIKISRNDLASVAGIAPETFIRTLTIFKKEGIIKADGRNIKVIDVQKLKNIS